jgi:hypothetical protein
LGRDDLLLGGELEEVCDRLEETERPSHYRAPSPLHAGICLSVQPLEGKSDPNEEGQSWKEEKLEDLQWAQRSFPL